MSDIVMYGNVRLKNIQGEPEKTNSNFSLFNSITDVLKILQNFSFEFVLYI